MLLKFIKFVFYTNCTALTAEIKIKVTAVKKRITRLKYNIRN